MRPIGLLNSQNYVKVNWKELPLASGEVLPRKVFEEIKLKNEIFGDIFLKTVKAEGEGRQKIILSNRFGKELGSDELSVYPENRNIFDFSIKIKPEYRRTKFKFGELLRLAGIMEMVENQSNHIKLSSKDSAIYFHSKYKFVPDFVKFKERDYAIKTVMNDDSPDFADLAHEAKELFNLIEATRNNPSKQRELCTQVSEITERYIQRALQDTAPEKKHPFNWSMDMILTKENLEKNRDFFNRLYEKHNIDFTI